MSPVVLAIAASTAPLVALGLVAGRRRAALLGAAVLLLAALACAGAGVLTLSDLWALPAHAGLAPDLVLLLMWAVLGALCRAGGPLAIPGPPVLSAVLAGATIGEVPAAALLAAGATSPKDAARRALAAAAGGMIGRLGDPAMVLIGSRFPEIVPQLAPLGVLLALVAAPRASSAQTGKPGLRELALLAVALAALRPEWTLASVGVGIAVAGWFARAEIRSVPWAHVGWAAIAAALALIAIAGGTPEMAATGLELIGEQLGDWAAPGLTLAGALLAALSDGTAASVVGLGVLDRALSLQIPGAPAALAAGLAVGGLGPLLVAGALRAGWKLWLFQVMIVAMYTAWVVA